MATKKIAPKKAVKPVKKVAPVKKAKAAAKPVAKKTVKPAKPVKKVAPVKKAKAAAKPVAKKTVKPAKPVKKVAPVKKAKAAAKPVAKKTVKPAKPVKKAAPAKKVKVVVKPVAKKTVKPAKPVKEKKQKIEKPVKIKKEKVEKIKPIKVPKAPKEKVKKILKASDIIKKSAPKVTKASGIEKSTTIIPLKQRPKKANEEPVKELKAPPKTSVKTSKPYQPGYTPLGSRVEVAAPGAPLVRYSDAELNEFKEIIIKKLESAKRELAYFQGVITRKDETGDNDEGRYMTMEDGSLSMEREQIGQMASRTISYIDNLNKALMRIENKTYGVCRKTGKLIDKARLRAVPHATLSLEAKLGLVKTSSEE